MKVAVLKERIKKVPPLDIIGENYRAKGASNLRGGPSVEYKKVGSLDEGEVFNVIGQVKDSNWYMVSQNGVGSGFIRSDLVEAAPDAELVIDESLIDETQLEQAEIAQERVCKTVEQTVTLADGTTESGTVEACQGANGWEVNV